MFKVVMPRIDPGMQTGFIVEWLKKEGDYVKKGEPLAIGEGEKTTFDIIAPESGILRRQLYAAKAEVQVTDTIAIIGEAQERIEEDMPKHVTQESAARVVSVSATTEPKPEEILPVSPAARRLAREHKIDLRRVKGTGPNGRITQEDVLKLVSSLETTQGSVAELEQPKMKSEANLSPTRKTIAERLSYSHQTIPTAAIMIDARVDALLELRRRLARDKEEVSFTAFLVKALGHALTEDSTFNSSIAGDSIQTYEDVNAAVAIQGPDGLVTPVVHRVREKSIGKISEEIRQLTEKVATRRLSLSELVGSTITVSNLGPQGVDTFVPIINPPNSAILGVGQIRQSPEVVDGKITHFDSVITLTLVFDHRIGDGVAASNLLSRIKQLLESPETLAK